MEMDGSYTPVANISKENQRDVQYVLFPSTGIGKRKEFLQSGLV
jgi:hypothetical protein